MPAPLAGEQRPSMQGQFAAVLRKNFLLQTRGRRAFCGLGGWTALLLEIAVPAAFFVLMCIPKHFIQPQPVPQQAFQAMDLDLAEWGSPYKGPASTGQQLARILYAPKSMEAGQLMQGLAQATACPADPLKLSPYSQSFHKLFRPLNASDRPAECTNQQQCRGDARCWQHVLDQGQLRGFASEAELVAQATTMPQSFDAAIVLGGQQEGLTDITIRMNHTDLPSTRQVLSLFDLLPDPSYKKYWFFVNLQRALEQAVIEQAAAGAVAGHTPSRRALQGIDTSSTAPLGSPGLAAAAAGGLVRFKPFPWPALMLDIGAGTAGLAFILLLVFAFLSPTRSAVASIVREKELRLREGMAILGLKGAAYWASWALTHFLIMSAAGVVCALIGLYPFRHSNFIIMLGFYWSVAAALIAFAYFISTLFSTSRTASTATTFLYVLAMVPGYLMPSLQPYGGLGWHLACLLPPSCISLYANILTQLETSQRGISWDTLTLSVTSERPFAACNVLSMLLLDVLLYSVLVWYLDQVWPGEVGLQQPWYFPALPRYWQRAADDGPAARQGSDKQGSDPGAGAPAVSIRELCKSFRTTDGSVKQAVAGLSLDMSHGQITALLGHNGAGKTTTISILTGVIPPTSGEATIDGLSISHDMPRIRRALGVCPQFDVLWPDLTVQEHLLLFAAVKGFASPVRAAVAAEAAQGVGLQDKIDAPAGELSGGQRRKLSVAIAFLGSPSVVFLDEPTSGMDPYSRRFTWDVIKRQREHCAIILTTHSMEEADILCDRIAIMASGRLAAVGTPLDLKGRFGVGYTLTVVQQAGRSGAEASSAQLAALVQRHVEGAVTLEPTPGEAAFKLPKAASSRFPALLRELDGSKEELRVASYGLAVTTLEEVFMRVSEQGAAGGAGPTKGEEEVTLPLSSSEPLSPPVQQRHQQQPAAHDQPSGQRLQPAPLHGCRLYAQQCWGLFVKRALTARRDRLAVVTQLLVPIALVLVALWSGRASAKYAQEPALAISRQRCLISQPAAWGASAGARANQSAALARLQQTYKPVVDSQQTRLWDGPFFSPTAGTLDGYLLDNWHQGPRFYDGLFVAEAGQMQQAAEYTGANLTYTLLVNQSATHGLPAAVNSLSNALLRSVPGQKAASIRLTSQPLPTLPGERSLRLNELSGDLLLVLCMAMMASVLSASFAVFLVRERENNSKHVQMVSGAPVSAFWISTYVWDLLNFCLPAAGILVCFALFNLPQFRGTRMAATAVLLWLFGLAALPLTYAVHFLFDDEMKALQYINAGTFLLGYLGFLATWIMDMIWLYLHKAAVRSWNDAIKHVLRLASPHYNLARGLYDISATYGATSGQPNRTPWSWEVTGRAFMLLGGQAAAFFAVTLFVEAGCGHWAVHAVQRGLPRLARRLQGRGGYEVPPEQGAPEEDGMEAGEEDSDVRQERQLLQAGGAGQADRQVQLDGLRKTFSQGWRRAPVRAVDGLWLAIRRGECFGLLGVNGAGKSTTFKLLTGELLPSSGEAVVCGLSLVGQLSRVRRLIGYCPQFDALPGLLTGREVLRMYARLRGIRSAPAEDMAGQLLQRLGLSEYADRVCSSYSGGNRRKLSVAVALVGDPPVVLMDEPSTGMDPGARRHLWGIIQQQVLGAGRTVLLTSHSMEECEALCTRTGIMARGRLACLGTVQHLKDKFAAGYHLDMRLTTDSMAAAAEMVLARCPRAQLLDRSACRLAYSIPQQGLDLPGMFAALEAARVDVGLEEYSLSQTTLEQVFVTLAGGTSEAA